MERLGVVSKDRLMGSSCRDGWFAVHDEQRRVHEGKNTLVVDSHSKGYKRYYERSSKNKLDRKLAKMKVQLEVMTKFIQRNMVNQRYGWVLHKKIIKWS